MEEFIVEEASLFLDSLFAGLLLMAFYDILRLLRRVIRHKNILVDIEDFLFWSMAGIFIFALIYSENDGRIRWFIILGIIIGAIVYAKSFGSFLVKYTARYINKFLNMVLKKPINKVKMTIRNIFSRLKASILKISHTRKDVEGDGKKLRKKEKIT